MLRLQNELAAKTAGLAAVQETKAAVALRKEGVLSDLRRVALQQQAERSDARLAQLERLEQADSLRRRQLLLAGDGTAGGSGGGGGADESASGGHTPRHRVPKQSPLAMTAVIEDSAAEIDAERAAKADAATKVPPLPPMAGATGTHTRSCHQRSRSHMFSISSHNSMRVFRRRWSGSQCVAVGRSQRNTRRGRRSRAQSPHGAAVGRRVGGQFRWRAGIAATQEQERGTTRMYCCVFDELHFVSLLLLLLTWPLAVCVR